MQLLRPAVAVPLIAAGLGLLLLAAGCRPPDYDQGDAPGRASYAPAAPTPSYSGGSSGSSYSAPAASATPAAPAAPSWVQRSASPTGTTELYVVNDYVVPQYVFVDGSYIGTVATGSRARFDISVGHHTFVFSDSMSPDDNPRSYTGHVGQSERLTTRIFTTTTH